MFLSEPEVRELTGGERHADQMRWLDDHKIPYEVNARGEPVVLRSTAPEPRASGYEPYTPPPTALYRHYDTEGHLLYVGISLSVLARLQQHRWGSHWFYEVAHIEIEWYPSRKEAEEAEQAAIMRERPRFNILHADG